jgi:uncharacterized membrane protein
VVGGAVLLLLGVVVVVVDGGVVLVGVTDELAVVVEVLAMGEAVLAVVTTVAPD